jgi:hypothetical protein
LVDFELRLARLQAELDAFRVRRDDERGESNRQIMALEERLAAHAAALLVLTGAGAALPPDAQTAVPDALRLWAIELRARNDERGAIAAEALADLLLRTLSTPDAEQRQLRTVK